MYVDAMISFEHNRCEAETPSQQDNEPILEEPTYPVRQINSNTFLLPTTEPSPFVLNENDVKSDWYQARKKVFKRSQLTIVFVVKDMIRKSTQVSKPELDDALQSIRESGANAFLLCLDGKVYV